MGEGEGEGRVRQGMVGEGRIRGREERGVPYHVTCPMMHAIYLPTPTTVNRQTHNFVCRRYQEDVMSNAKCSLSDNPWFIVHMFEYFRGGGGCPCTVGSNFNKFEPVWGHVQ